MSTVEWLRFTGPDRKKWTVLLTDDPVDEWCDLAGLCEWDTRRIYVSTRQSDEQVDETLLHEISHLALIDVEDVREVPLDRDYAKNFTAAELAEERVIWPMSLKLWPMLQRIGLPWPAKPESFSAMSRRRRPAKKKAS